jgi:hypothetical protein
MAISSCNKHCHHTGCKSHATGNSCCKLQATVEFDALPWNLMHYTSPESATNTASNMTSKGKRRKEGFNTSCACMEVCTVRVQLVLSGKTGKQAGPTTRLSHAPNRPLALDT